MAVGYAVVGLGRFAQERILPALQKTKSAKLAALVSGDLIKAGELSAQYGRVPTYTYDSFHRMLENPEVDAVYIALPNSLHWQYTVDAANGGKHVLCEKPMAISASECLSMIEACRKNKVKLMIGYRVHFDPGNHEAIRLLREGAVGQPKFIQATFSQRTVDPDEWRLHSVLSGGGPLMDIGIYCVNAFRYLLNAEPERVVGMVSSIEPVFDEVEENASAVFEFPNGVLASLLCSFGTARVESFVIDGSEGWLRLDHAFDYWTPRELTLWRGDNCQTRIFSPGDQVAAEIDYFSECIEANIEPEPSGEEGLKDMIALEAVYRSARDRGYVQVNYQSISEAA